jgi:hypothetical protein
MNCVQPKEYRRTHFKCTISYNEAGLVNLYRDDEDVKLYSKMLNALSFVSPEDVGAAFDALNDSRPDNLENVCSYWEDSYVGRLRRNRCANPLFPITLRDIRGST